MTTPREQLKEILKSPQHAPESTPREALVRVMHAEVCCPCDPYGCDVAEVSENRYADAIIQANWTPPPTPAHNTTTEN